ncbi:putative C-S lyase [Marinifilum sp. N1E240]|uniref:MalY/PatB family protein n=1 Tax=Marinifilum sp. N1E240 TaxID=2608082 RepID=UPI00128DD503|nr:MalY/PatB family protein [Marinifilum sp. N1E240]MPQ47564.1 putative C-S lyase [Marinifilum sp. N1E240]
MKYNFDEIINRKKTNSVKYDKLKQYFGKDDLLPFWVADTDFKVPTCISDAIVKRANHEIYGYSFRGDDCISSVQSWLKKRHEWNVPLIWISSSPGVVTALSLLLMSLTEKGDKIAVQPPVYHPFFHVVNDTERCLVYNPLIRTKNSYEMDFKNLELLAKNGLKAILLSNPHNPVGRVWNKNELLRLGEIARKYDFLIISDEIHQDLIYSDYKHIPLASLSEDLAQRTITCIAPSKTFNVAGLASSVIIIPNQKLKKQYEKLLSAMHLDSGNLFGHIAMQAGYENGKEWLEQLMDYLESNVNFVKKYLKNNIPEIKLVEPEATYLLWLDCRELEISTEKLNKILIDSAKVALNKGTTFGKEGEGYMRLNIGCPKSVLLEGLSKIKQVIKK